MLNEQRILQHLRPRRYVRLDVFEVLDSTNRYLMEQVHRGAPDWTVAIADRQTAGQGRQGRSWESPPNVGLWFSVLRRGASLSGNVHLWNVWVAVTLAEALERWMYREMGRALPIRLKWPNDLWVHDRKLGGMLLQGSFTGGAQDYLVIGIGLNVNQQREDFSPAIRPLAVSLRMATQRLWDRERLFAHLLNTLFEESRTFPEAAGGSLISAYWDRLMYKEEMVQIRIHNKTWPARIVGLTDEGLLMVERPDGEKTVIASGEVDHLRGGAHAAGH